MISFEIPVASEVLNLLNFLFGDILFIAVVMWISSRIAGLTNYRQVEMGRIVDLKLFSLPHIGGGIVMGSGPRRTFLIIARTTAIIAVCISNFGLQGRSRTPLETKEALVRKPGPTAGIDQEKLFDSTEIRMRCAKPTRDNLIFGSVIDGNCYPDLRDHVYVKFLALQFKNVTRSVTNCTHHVDERRFSTVLKCRGMDMWCSGPFQDSDEILGITCETILYDKNVSWYCPSKGFLPEVRGPQVVSCREIGAVQKDIQYWSDIYAIRSNDVIVSVFASAYGAEERRMTNVPTKERSFTIVTLWWIIPSLWELLLILGLMVLFFQLRQRGAEPLANDERRLTQMLKNSDKVGFETTKTGYEVEWI